MENRALGRTEAQRGDLQAEGRDSDRGGGQGPRSEIDGRARLPKRPIQNVTPTWPSAVNAEFGPLGRMSALTSAPMKNIPKDTSPTTPGCR
jgi:hypothetical protein